MNVSSLDRIAMRSFSSLEQESLYQMVCGAMSVDGYRDPRESALVEEIVNLIGLTDAERVASRSLDQPTMLRTLKSMPEIKKCYLAKFVCQVVLADGIVDPKEETFVKYYFNLLDIPEID